MSYQSYWKSEFQSCLTNMKGKGNLKYWEEISDSLSTVDAQVWEYVYRYYLQNPAASILVFSSVYKKTDRSREVNSDAVRIIYEWQTKNGLRYSKVAKRYRVENLFLNLESSLVKASESSFDLYQYEWVNNIQETDILR